MWQSFKVRRSIEYYYWLLKGEQHQQHMIGKVENIDPSQEEKKKGINTLSPPDARGSTSPAPELASIPFRPDYCAFGLGSKVVFPCIAVSGCIKGNLRCSTGRPVAPFPTRTVAFVPRQIFHGVLVVIYKITETMCTAFSRLSVKSNGDNTVTCLFASQPPGGL